MKRVLTIAKKDIAQSFRNRFVMIITIMVLLLFTIVYYLMPSDMKESLRVAVLAEPEFCTNNLDIYSIKSIEYSSKYYTEELKESLEAVVVDSPGEMESLIEDGEVGAGFHIQRDGSEFVLNLMVSSKLPNETIDAVKALAVEMARALSGFEPPAEISVETVGPDMAGRQIPMRDKLRVIFLSFIFLLELYGLGNLLMEEVQSKTAHALLVTPVNIREFVSAKALTGIASAFIQGLVLALLLGAITGRTTVPILIFILLGSGTAVGLAFIIGALSRDFISMVMVSIFPFMILMIPGYALLYPGVGSSYMKAIPTYWFVNPINEILNYGASPREFLSSIACLFLFGVFFFSIGYLAFKRRVQ